MSNEGLFPEERVVFAQDPATGNAFLVTGKGRIPLGALSEWTYLPGRVLVRRDNAATTDVWSLSTPPQKLGTVSIAGTQVTRGSDTFYSADGTGVRLAASNGAPGVTTTPFTSASLRGATGVHGFVRNQDNDVLVVESGAAVRGGAVLRTTGLLAMALGRLEPGGAVAFSDGNPIASGSGGFVAWTADGAKALPPVGFSASSRMCAFRSPTLQLRPPSSGVPSR